MVMRTALCECRYEFLPLSFAVVSVYNLCKTLYKIFTNIRPNIPVRHPPFKTDFRVVIILRDYFVSGDRFVNIISTKQMKHLQVYLSASGKLCSLIQESLQVFALGKTKSLHLSDGRLNHSAASLILPPY